MEVMEEINLIYNTNLCRICQNSNDLNLIHTSTLLKSGKTYLDLLKSVFIDIPWPDDNLLSLACHSCVKVIEDTVEFKRICLASNTRRAIITNNRNSKSEISDLYFDQLEVLKELDDFEMDKNSLKEEIENKTASDNKRMERIGLKRHRKDGRSKNNVTSEKIVGEMKIVGAFEITEKELSKRKGHFCEFCPTYLPTLERLERHVYKHNGVRNYTCHGCDTKYITRQDLSTHSRLWCTQAKSMCSLCPSAKSKRFSRELLAIHMKIEHMIEDKELIMDGGGGSGEGAEFNDGDASFRKGRMSKRKGGSKLNVKVFTCHICQMQFTRSIHLDKHVYKHDGTRNHVCSCDAKFITIADLRNHKRIVHVKREDYKFLCMECGARFPLSSGLKMHVLRNHTENRNFTCDICHKSFYEKRDVQTHLASHSNRREFKCDLCPAEYKYKNVLLLHKTKTHGIGNYKRKALEKYKCPFCLKIISSKSKLPRHIRTHTGVRPFKCRLCDTKFTCKSYVKNHVKVKHHVDVEASDFGSYLYYEVCESGNPVEESGGIPVNSDEEEEVLINYDL